MTAKIASLLAFVFLAPAAGGQPGAAPPRVPEITASGRGEVTITPDRAMVLVSVESRASSAAAAAADNSRRMAAVLEALRRTGLSQSDITTSSYTVGQDPRSLRVAPGTGVPTIPVEFLARNAVRATVRRVDDVGKTIDAALTAGATSIASVQFSSATTDEARRNAIEMAVAQAQREAEAMARSAGGSLGRLLSMSSGGSPVMAGGYAGDPYAFDRELASAAYYPTMVNPRDLTVTATVFGRWEFIPGVAR